MKPRKTLSVYVLLVGILGLSIVGGILTFQIFSAATKSQLTSAQTVAIKPIDGSINEEIINNLEKRIRVQESEIDQLGVAPLILPTPSPTATPILTPTATESGSQLEQNNITSTTPTATESANL